MDAVPVEDVGVSQVGNHAQESQLAFVEDGTGWQGARQVVYGGPGSGGGELQEPLDGHLVVEVQECQVLGGEDQGGQATQEDRGGKHLVNSDRGSRVAIVVFGQAGREGSIECLGVCSDPGLDGGGVAEAGGPGHTDMLSLGGVGDVGAS